MNTLVQRILRKAGISVFFSSLVILNAGAAPLALQNVPLYLTSKVDPNVMLNMSVETPMGGAAYNDNVGIPASCTGRQTITGGTPPNDWSYSVGACYFETETYLGIFDPYKCYDYDTANTRYNPSGFTTGATLTNKTGNHRCSSQFSGNFLNWATMTAIDMFIHPMTGGNRVDDTTSLTVVRRARKQDNDSWFPYKVVGSTYNVATNTVTPWTETALFIYNTNDEAGVTAYGVQFSTNLQKNDNAYGNRLRETNLKNTTPHLVRAKVCDVATNVETNCIPYGTSPSVYFKPEGLIQKNAQSKRFAVMSYTMDGSKRDGGVLRSNAKYVGPKLPSGVANTLKEYGTDGILIHNPDSRTNVNSGVINYVNKFSDAGYKGSDPIGELFYEGVRYFKHLGPTPEYSGAVAATSLNDIPNNAVDAKNGGFWFGKAAADWQDPITNRCQKNFVVAINDANPWLDKKLPGTAFMTAQITDSGGNPYTLLDQDFGEPSNADPDINVRTLTNRVGDLEGLNGTTWTGSGTWTVGTSPNTTSGVNDSVGGGNLTWTNSCSDKTVAQLGEVMGTCPAMQKENSYYIAGLAFYANTYDLRGDFADDKGIQNVQSFIIDTQEFNTNPLDGNKNMLWLAGKYGGFNDTLNPTTKLGDGLPQTAEWDADGNGVPDNYVLATQPQLLVAGLNAAFDFIDNKDSSASSATLNAGSISSTTRVYQARFNSGDWSGQLLAYAIDPLTGQLILPKAWDASEEIPATRQIITRNSTGTPVKFQWADIDATRRTQLDPAPATYNATRAQARLNYIRGSQVNEVPLGYEWRKRTTKLGDIISSAPVFVGDPAFSYPDNLEGTTPATVKYSSFRATQSGRASMVYVGANDGMLHGFDATSGEEKFGYIPGALYTKLHTLTANPYTHPYFVDGSPNMGDVFYASAWHTILVGGLNGGGQGIYALDITNPATLAAAEANAGTIAKWEYTDQSDSTDTDGDTIADYDLGYTFSQPAIVRVKAPIATFPTGGRWVAIFGNGYNNTENDTYKSTTGNAALYVVNIQTGALIRKINTMAGTADDPTGASRPNGLATPALVDLDGDRTVDYAYAGDLFGNMWKFDLTDPNPANWKVSYKDASNNPLPLYAAKDAVTPTPNAQPITERPVVIRGPGGVGMMVLFGTGKYLEPADKNISPTLLQTFYGIEDANTGANTDIVSGRSDLQAQTILAELDPDGPTNPLPKIRVTSDETRTTSQKGWYLDLLSPSGYQAEKSVSGPTIRNGRVIFTTVIPDTDPCNFGGGSWIMELDALEGSRLDESPFDLNSDNNFSNTDYVTVTVVIAGVPTTITVPVSGVASSEGILPEPGIVDGNSLQYKYTPGTSGKIQITVENPGPGGVGRQSWRQIR